MPDASSYVVVALLYASPGAEDTLREYETRALGIVAEHGGELLAAVRPESMVDGVERPTEVHVLRFPDRAAFEAYRADPRHADLAARRAAAIARTIILPGAPVTYPGSGDTR